MSVQKSPTIEHGPYPIDKDYCWPIATYLKKRVVLKTFSCSPRLASYGIIFQILAIFETLVARFA